MGREALCECTFADTTAKAKVFLESEELILRGNIRLRAPLHALKNVRVEEECLCFSLDKRPIQLHLGAAVAKSWAKKITSPPPTLADKLGVTAKVLRTIGPVSHRALDSVLASAAMIRAEDPGHPLNEAAICTTLRAQGLMDTKVASVSEFLTALRFNQTSNALPANK
jgi:hypothetical protein